jgi:hypothetical protein
MEWPTLRKVPHRKVRRLIIRDAGEGTTVAWFGVDGWAERAALATGATGAGAVVELLARVEIPPLRCAPLRSE